MQVKISEIEARVWDLLDENRAVMEERMDWGDPGTDLGGLIRSLVPEAASAVMGAAPAGMFDDCAHARLRLQPDNDTGDLLTARLPADFLRILWIKADGWRRGVAQPLEYGGEAWQACARSVAGRRQRGGPAVAIRPRGDLRELEVYGASSAATGADLDYVARPAAVEGMIDLPPALIAEICRKTAEMTREITGSTVLD